MLAALNHPNIAAIYGLEKTVGFTALVMELVEAEITVAPPSLEVVLNWGRMASGK